MFQTVAIVGVVSTLLTAASSGLQSSARPSGPPTVSQEFLESIARLQCNFTVGANGRWAADVPTVRTSVLSRPLTMSFSDINVIDGSATAAEAGRTSSLSARSDRSNLYLLDIGSDGVVRLTTVFAEQTRTGRLKAVHTRTGRGAEQFYGDCAVTAGRSALPPGRK